MLTDAGLGFEPTVTQTIYVIEPIKDHFIMRYTNYCSIPINCHLAQQIHHNSGALRIERRGGLIGENYAGPISQRASNRHTLGFAARKLRGHRVLAMTDLEIVEQVDGARMCRRGAKSGKMQHHSDVVAAVEKWQQIGVLKDEADLIEPERANRP